MGFVLGAGRWLISNPWRLSAMAMGLVLAFLLLWRVPHLESTIKDRELTIANQKVQIATQNAAVDGWKAVADQAKANQKAAMDLADKAMDRAQNTVTKIQKEPVPTPDKECAATLQLLRKYQQ